MLRRRPASAEVVMEKAVEEILGGRVAGIGLGLDRFIGQSFGTAYFIHPNSVVAWIEANSISAPFHATTL